jgi:hypothetical protein
MMRQDDHQQAHFEGEQTHGGGAAPEHRRCQYVKADGKGCRDWAVRGQEFCYRHGVFLRAGRGIDVPLLEDESSIVLVLSETLRAVALRTMPANDGRLLLDGCRLAHTMHMDRLAAARLERREKREESEAGSLEQEAGSQEPEAESKKQEAGSSAAEAGSRKPEAGSPEPNRECGARCPEPGARSSVTPEPCEVNWDQVLAARAARLEELMEEEALATGVR